MAKKKIYDEWGEELVAVGGYVRRKKVRKKIQYKTPMERELERRSRGEKPRRTNQW